MLDRLKRHPGELAPNRPQDDTKINQVTSEGVFNSNNFCIFTKLEELYKEEQQPHLNVSKTVFMFTKLCIRVLLSENVVLGVVQVFEFVPFRKIGATFWSKYARFKFISRKK